MFDPAAQGLGDVVAAKLLVLVEQLLHGEHIQLAGLVEVAPEGVLLVAQDVQGVLGQGGEVGGAGDLDRTLAQLGHAREPGRFLDVLDHRPAQDVGGVSWSIDKVYLFTRKDR